MPFTLKFLLCLGACGALGYGLVWGFGTFEPDSSEIAKPVPLVIRS